MRRLAILAVAAMAAACAAPPGVPGPPVTLGPSPPPQAILSVPLATPVPPPPIAQQVPYLPPPPPGIPPAPRAAPPAAAAPPPVAAVAAVQTCFVPGGDCTGAVVHAIYGARREVLVQAYAFTSWEIARALAAARMRGVDVRAILDRREAFGRGNQLYTLMASGIPILIDGISGIAHNKVIVIDGRTVITGSFNFTRAAQLRNAENLLLIDDGAVAARYRANWFSRAAVSFPYAPALALGWPP